MFSEYRCKYPQQNASRLNLTTYKEDLHHSYVQLITGIMVGVTTQKSNTVITDHLKRKKGPNLTPSYDKKKKKKTLNKLNKGNFFNLIKGIYETPTANITLKGKILKAFPAKIRKKTRTLPSLITSIQHCIILEDLATAIRQEKERKVIHTGREKIKLLLLQDGMILYVENPKESTKNYYC